MAKGAKGTRRRFVTTAADEIGYREGPNNDTKYGTWDGAPNQPWCGAFVDWVAHNAGVALPGKMLYTPGGADAFRMAGRFHRTPERGDVVFYDFAYDGKGGIQHVGIVAEARGWPNSIVTVEGNTGDGVSQDNGDGVYRRVRYPLDIVGFGRPVYANPVLEALRSTIAATKAAIAKLTSKLHRKQRHLHQLTK